MATTSYLTPEDQAFIDAWRTQTAGTSYAKWGTTLPKLYSYADKLKNIQSYYTDAKTPETKQLAIDLGVQWLKANNPGVLDSNGNEFKNGFYADIISGDKTTRKSANDTLNKIRDTNATQYVDNVFNADKKLGTAQRAAEITKITQGTTAQPYNPTKLATAVNAVRSNAIVKPGTSVDILKAAYGDLKDSKGAPVFTDKDFKAVADATSLGAISKFNSKLDTLANNVLKAQQGSSYITADPVKTAAAKKALISDPTNFVTSVNALNKPTTTSTDTATTTDTTTTKPAGGIASLRTWRAPQQGIVTANSPYSGLLDATLAKITGANFGTPTNNAVYKNLTDPLTQGMGLDSLAKPELTYDTTNEAGITGLGNVSGTLDKLNTQVTSSPTYNLNQIANANTALENAANIAGKDVNPPVVNPPVVNPPVVNPPVVNPPVVNPPVVNPPVVNPPVVNPPVVNPPVVNPPVVNPPVVNPPVKTAAELAAEKAAADTAAADKAAVRGNSFLERDATNLGYRGDYTDTAAMNSFINANSQSVAPAVTQQPAVQASAVPSTQVLNSSGTPIPGRRRLGFA
jgi:hypothetical protein